MPAKQTRHAQTRVKPAWKQQVAKLEAALAAQPEALWLGRLLLEVDLNAEQYQDLRRRLRELAPIRPSAQDLLRRLQAVEQELESRLLDQGRNKDNLRSVELLLKAHYKLTDGLDPKPEPPAESNPPTVVVRLDPRLQGPPPGAFELEGAGAKPKN